MGHPEKCWEVGVFIDPGFRKETRAECRALGVKVKSWERMRTLGGGWGRAGSARKES